MTGRIKNAKSRGFGFIETSGGIDFFFHESAFKGDFKTLLRDVALGKKPKVNFEQDITSDRGPRAVNITLASEDSSVL